MITDSFIRALTIDKTYRKGMQIFSGKRQDFGVQYRSR